MARETEIFTLPSGATIEVEVLPYTGRGARDVSDGRRSPDRFEEAIAPLKETVELVLRQLDRIGESVDSVSVQMGASFKGGAKLVLVSGEIGSTLKITVNWKRPEK